MVGSIKLKIPLELLGKYTLNERIAKKAPSDGMHDASMALGPIENLQSGVKKWCNLGYSTQPPMLATFRSFSTSWEWGIDFRRERVAEGDSPKAFQNSIIWGLPKT